jgi:hypothetical protein
MSETAEPGDFICVEIDDLQEPWMIGRVKKHVEEWSESMGEQYHYMGKVIPGDKVVWVQKLEGCGNVFTVTEKEFPVFVEDVRMVKFRMDVVKTRTSGRGQSNRRVLERFQIPSDVKATIIASMPMTLDVHTKASVRETYFK